VLHCITHPLLRRGPPHPAAIEQLIFYQQIFNTPLL
jgi:hypothetical protein